MKWHLVLLAGVLVLALVATAPVSAADSIEVNDGDDQSAVVGEAVETPPGVIVKDDDGAPMEGVTVVFEVTDGDGTVSPEEVTTDAEGIAAVSSWTLGETAGQNELTVSADTGNEIVPETLTFTATGIAGPADDMEKIAGDGQSATAGTAVSTPPSVRVADKYDNPVSGATVSFSVTPGSAIVSGDTETDSEGIATVGSWTLGTVTGTNELTATTGSLSVTFTAQATESTDPPTISSISPAIGLNTGTLTGVSIAGTHFSSGGVTVNLTKSNTDNITGTCTRTSATAITCSFPLSGKDDGSWNVVVENADGQTVTKTGGFTIVDESDSDVTITSISPVTAMAGDNVDFTITGKDFITTLTYEVYLYNSDHDENITAEDVEVKSSTKIIGTFDLDDDAEVDTYYVCIDDPFGGTECRKNAFKITTNEVGSIEISSSPSGATIYIDDTASGTTPKTIDDLVAGSYKITLKKSGYQDWGKIVKVEDDETTEVDATLSAAAASAVTTTRTTVQSTPRPTTPATAGTTVITSLKVPTTWADTPTIPEESPAGPLVVIGGLCLVFISMRKH
jgi:hypothetical protein